MIYDDNDKMCDENLVIVCGVCNSNPIGLQAIVVICNKHIDDDDDDDGVLINSSNVMEIIMMMC